MTVRKERWVRSTNGPDWTDIETMMRALEGLHTGEIIVTVSTVGIGATGGLVLSAMHVLETLSEGGTHTGVGVDTLWPSKDSATLEGALYALLYRLDYAISEHYKQQEIPV